MKGLKTYFIPFIGLKQGIHHFTYKIDENFFSCFSDSLIKKGKINVELDFDKKENFFVLNFMIKGTVNVECDRCLDYFDMPISSNNKIVVKYDEELRNQNDQDAFDIIYISRAII